MIAKRDLLNSDFTYVSTWQGFVYVVFIIDVFRAPRCGMEGLDEPADRFRAEADIAPSVGGDDDSYDNVLVETISGLYKAEAILTGATGRVARQ